MSSSSRSPVGHPPKHAPRVGYTCGSHWPGHNVHYTAVLKRSTDLIPLAADLEASGEAFTLRVEGETFRVHIHNVQALRDLIYELGASCWWYPTLSLAFWPTSEVRHWVSHSPEPLRPCVLRE